MFRYIWSAVCDNVLTHLIHCLYATQEYYVVRNEGLMNRKCEREWSRGLFVFVF